MKAMSLHFSRSIIFVTMAVLAITTVPGSAGPRIRGGGSYHSSRNVNIHSNRNVNVHSNRNVNINSHRHVDVDIDRHYRGGIVRPGFAAGLVTGAVIGSAIQVLPRGYAPIYVGRTPYMYYGGVYYQQASSGYVVVEPPIGAIVPELPPGAALVVVSGINYYLFNGLYYQPVLVSGVTQYRTVRF